MATPSSSLPPFSEGADVERFRNALTAAREYAESARGAAAEVVVQDGRVRSQAADKAQRLLHGLAWIVTTVEAMSAVLGWLERARQAEAANSV